MLHNAIQFFAFVSPLHRRGTYVAPYSHELMDQHLHGGFILDHAPQFRLGRDLVPLDAKAQTPHGNFLHSETFPLRFHQQQGVHESPNLAMTATPRAHQA